MRLQTRHQGRSQEPQALLPPQRGHQVYVHQQWACLLFPGKTNHSSVLGKSHLGAKRDVEIWALKVFFH